MVKLSTIGHGGIGLIGDLHGHAGALGGLGDFLPVVLDADHLTDVKKVVGGDAQRSADLKGACRNTTHIDSGYTSCYNT